MTTREKFGLSLMMLAMPKMGEGYLPALVVFIGGWLIFILAGKSAF